MHQRSGNPDTMAARRNKHRASRVAGPNPWRVGPTHRSIEHAIAQSVDATDVRWPDLVRMQFVGATRRVLNLLWPDCMAGKPRCEGD